MLIRVSCGQGTQGGFSHVLFDDESIRPIVRRHDSRRKRNGQRNGLSWDDKWMSLLTPLHRVFPYGETRSLKLDTTSYLEDEICVVPNKSSDTYCCVWCVACQCGGFGWMDWRQATYCFQFLSKVSLSFSWSRLFLKCCAIVLDHWIWKYISNHPQFLISRL